MARRKIDTNRPDIQAALDRGWVYGGLNRRCHPWFTHPRTSVKLTLAGTPSDWRGVRNGIAWIKRNTPPAEENS